MSSRTEVEYDAIRIVTHIGTLLQHTDQRKNFLFYPLEFAKFKPQRTTKEKNHFNRYTGHSSSSDSPRIRQRRPFSISQVCLGGDSTFLQPHLD